MFTPEELHALHDDIFQRMLVAAWLKNYSNTEGKGWHLRWTATGAIAAIDLKMMHRDLELDGGDERPAIASILAHGLTPDPRSDPETVNAAFRPFLKKGLAWRAAFVHKRYSEVEWTEEGKKFCARLTGLLAELKIEMGDEDRLLALFSIAEGWAPDENTKLVVD